MACHWRPPAKRGGGASATALRIATRFARTPVGHASRKSAPGMDSVGSSSRWRWKKTAVHGLYLQEGEDAALERGYVRMGARAYGAQRVGFRAQAPLSTILRRVHRRPTVVYGGCGRGRDRGVGRDTVATRYAQMSLDTGTWRRHASGGCGPGEAKRVGFRPWSRTGTNQCRVRRHSSDNYADDRRDDKRDSRMTGS